MPNRLYTQREVSLIFDDVPNKTLIYWARQGLVEWAAEKRDARGIARLYSYWNLFQVGLVREFAGLGFSIESIQIIMDFGFKGHPKQTPYLSNDQGEEVKSYYSWFYYFDSEHMPNYFIIFKGAEERGFENTRIEMLAFSNLTKDDSVQLNFSSEKPKSLRGNITATIIINLSGIMEYLNDRIEKANIK
jgi:DNA-binding transcriptional MerR regulator